LWLWFIERMARVLVFSEWRWNPGECFHRWRRGAGFFLMLWCIFMLCFLLLCASVMLHCVAIRLLLFCYYFAAV
jgi:hypothetical protein